MIQRKSRKGGLSPIAAVAAIAVLLTTAARAGTLKNKNLTQLISDSRTIVQGVVQSVTDGIDERGIPYTEVTLFVKSSAKGDMEDETTYTFRQFGLLEPRTLENGHRLLPMTPAGFARWHEGESVVAFLYEPASMTGLQTTTGLAQGKLTGVHDLLVNQFDNAGLFADVVINEELLSPEGKNMLTTPGPVDAETFMNLVHRAVSEQWIENGEMQ